MRVLESLPFGSNLFVHRYELENGLSVLVLPDRSAKVACVQNWYKVGSRHESLGKTGLSHLFEHLMFNETTNVPYGKFDRLLEEAGAESNASTYVDWTYYVVYLPSEALDLALRLEADRMQNLVLRDEQVASEREVVANERRQTVDDDVDGTASEELYKLAFQQHGYGWPTIGFMDDIAALSTEDCREFYRHYYAPNNALLVVVGDVEPEDLLARVQRHYGDIKAANVPVEQVCPEPPQTAERRLHLRKPCAAHKVAVGYRGPALGDFDHPHLVLLNEILCGGRSSRLYQKLVQEGEIATHLNGSVGSFRDPALYEVWITAREKHTADELIHTLDEQLERVCREPVSQEELDRAKAKIELSTLQGLETVCGRGSQIGFCETVLRDPVAGFTRLAAYRRAERPDLLRAARRYLRHTARSIVQVSPDTERTAEESP